MSNTENTFPEALVTFHDKLPPRWQVDIVEVSCKFIFDDGYNDDMGQKVRIRAGESYTPQVLLFWLLQIVHYCSQSQSV